MSTPSSTSSASRIPHVMVLMAMTEKRGGGERMLQYFAEHASPETVRLTVVFFGEGELVDAVRAIPHVTVRVVHTGRLRHVHRYVQAVQRIAELAQTEAVDLLFSWTGKPHLYGGMVSALTGIPAGWYQLGIPEGRHLSWIDRLTNLLPTAGVVTLSRRAQKAQRALWPPRPVELVYPCYDARTFDTDRLPPPGEARRELGLSTERPLIGMVGRLQEWKGMHTLIRAMPAVLKQHPDALAAIVGGVHDLEPGYKSRLQHLIQALSLQEHVRLVGYQSNVPLWMQAMDVFVHASDAEPFGIVLIEALALGKPVIAGAKGGPQEILGDTGVGRLVAFEDHDDMATALDGMLSKGPSDKASIAARQAVADAYHPRRYAAALTGALYTLVGVEASTPRDRQVSP